MGEVTVNFITFDEARDACLMVLVEEGPWTGPITDHLHRLQDRIYGCLEAALDGQLAEQFPNSQGKTIVVRIDCYDLPREEISDFTDRFVEGIRSLPDYSTEASRLSVSSCSR